MVKFKEIELKFNAKDIPLGKFIEFAEARMGRMEKSSCCGYDHFYDKPDGVFLRHRTGDAFNQLTFKQKLTAKDNFIRTENNLTLGAKVTKEEVAGLCWSLGYQFNTSLFKQIFVYVFPQYVLSYYIVYNTDLEELGRFIEIEAAEEHEWSSEDEAWGRVVAIEREASVLGITPQHRIKKSLYELYKEDRE